MKLRFAGLALGLLITAVAYAQVKVSSLSTLNAPSATYVYGITNSATDGKVPVGGTNGLAYFDGSTNLIVSDGTNIPLGTTTGTQLGTGSTQKLGFFGATPVVQQTGNALTALQNLGLVTSATLTATNVGLGSVTNNAQTQAAIVPNTAPSAGQVLVGNAGGTAYAPVTLSGSGATATLSSAGVLTLSAIAPTSITTGTSGANIPLLNGANTWSGVQSFNSGDVALKGATSGTITLNAAATAGSNTVTLPAGTTDFSATGGASQVVKQTSSGGAFTVARLACADLSDVQAPCNTATGTSGATIPLLNGANTYSGASTFSSTLTDSVAGAASAPGLTVSGVPFAGTGTTSFPQLYVNVNTATASTTLATAGTALGVNGHGAIDLINLLEDGTSQFKVNSTGTATVATAVSAPSVTGTSTINYGSALRNSNNTHTVLSATAPTIGSGFGTSPSVVANNGTAAFTINVGTGGSASSGVVTMPAATAGWACNVTPNAAPQANAIMYSAPTSTTSITITNYTLSTGVALAWSASAVLQVTCVGY